MEYSKLIFGSMYSGKTEELIRQMKRLIIAGKKCQLFKPIIDNRYDSNNIVTHDKANVLTALAVKNSDELLSNINSDTQVIGIDEVQFFDDNIINVIETLNAKNIRVLASGLDMYCDTSPFGNVIPILACKCKYVEKVHAVCIDCGQTAMYSYKLNNNIVPNIDIGSEGKYIALCESCREKRLKEIKNGEC